MLFFLCYKTSKKTLVSYFTLNSQRLFFAEHDPGINSYLFTHSKSYLKDGKTKQIEMQEGKFTIKLKNVPESEFKRFFSRLILVQKWFFFDSDCQRKRFPPFVHLQIHVLSLGRGGISWRSWNERLRGGLAPLCSSSLAQLLRFGSGIKSRPFLCLFPEDETECLSDSVLNKRKTLVCLSVCRPSTNRLTPSNPNPLILLLDAWWTCE